MSRKDQIERHAVPEGRKQQFILMMELAAEITEVNEIPQVAHHIKLTREAVERSIFEDTHSVSPAKKLTADTKKYVAIFRQRYLQLTDLEYARQITPIDGKTMKMVAKELTAVGFEVEEYLKWLFDEFLSENPKFCPPNIKWTGSAFVLDKFLYENRQKMREKRDAETRKVEMLDLINRARALMRGFLAAGRVEDKEKVKDILKKHRDEGIMVTEFRGLIEGFERQLGKRG